MPIRCVLVVLAIAGSARLLRAGQPPAPFDEDAVRWQTDLDRRADGLAAAEAFRQSLHCEGAEPTAWQIGVLLERFRTKYPAPLADRPTLRGFRLSAKEFAAQLRGERHPPGDEAFAAFSGRWYGLWDGNRVDHHWHPTEKIGRRPRGELPILRSVQYAWIGDGFGWNYLARPDGRAGETVLGQVSHVEAGNPESIHTRFPLVGATDGPTRLIWVTPFGAFFEEVFPGKTRERDRYAITGLRFRILDGRLATDGPGFQAVYTRDPQERPEWLTFPVELAID